MADKTASLAEIMRFFGFDKPAEFRTQWAKLTTEDKTQLRTGIADGTLTY